MDESSTNPQDPTGEAVSRRLAKLRNERVELSAFDERFEKAFAEEVRERGRWFIGRQYQAMAASLALLLTIAAVSAALVFSAQPARASEKGLLEIYQRSVSQHGAAMPVHSFEEARATLRRKWAGAPDISEADTKDLHVMSCCVHDVGRKQMASVTFLMDGSPVTAAVARSEDIRPPSGMKAIAGAGRSVTSSAEGINMVMQERAGVWTCVMGRPSAERLGELLDSMQNDAQ